MAFFLRKAIPFSENFAIFAGNLKKKLVKLVGQIVSQKGLCHKPSQRSRLEWSVAMYIIICERAHKIYIKTDTYSKCIVGSYDITTDMVCTMWAMIYFTSVRREGDGILFPAMHKNGWDYPEQAVKERANLAKYFCVILCLIPVSYTSWLPATNVCTCATNYNDPKLNRVYPWYVAKVLGSFHIFES